MTLPMTEEEFERQYKAATARGNLRLKMQPLAVAVRWDRQRGAVIDLNNNCQFCVPLSLLPELAAASPSQLRQVELLGRGQAIHWTALDESFDVLQLLTEALQAVQEQDDRRNRGNDSLI